MAKRRECWLPSDWPALDHELWEHALQDGDLFGPTTPAIRWRPRTVQTVAEGYGYAVAWLARNGLLDHSQSPEARWPKDRLRRYMEDMEARLSSATVQNRLISLERALAALVPRSDRAILRAAIRNGTTRPDHADKRRRLQDPARLVELGLELMSDAERGRHENPRRNAVIYRDGLEIAMLAMRAFRKGNFAGIRVGTHLVHQREGWWLCFPREETKTDQLIEVPFPQELVRALERYLAHYRPLLAGDRYRGDRLWVSYRFGPQSAHTLQLNLVRHTQAAFGRPVNPHLFRDCVATSIAIHDPENVRMAATVLGHRTFASTERHYNLARTLEAGRSYAAIIRERRGASNRLRRVRS
jgi:integrase/recombinase XerD